ncbi:MAG: ACT domain-containing protein, partial [Acidobacteriaceae bacterium]|nr:ACT domain-containing protein [Acidobacteriaceae bacterium]
MSNTAVLLITCPDRKGLVASVANLLYQHGANIAHADQHQDPEAGLFFMRIEWLLEEFDLKVFEAAFRELAESLDMHWRLVAKREAPRVAIFVSHYLHCLIDILHRQQIGELHCSIPLVVSNHPDAEALTRFYGIEFQQVPVTAESKEEAEEIQLR